MTSVDPILADTRALPALKRSAAPLRMQVVDELRQAIISGRLESGARLMERALIDMLGVSRTVVREALRQLESEGLIAVLPNKGPVVRELTQAEAKDLYSIRAVLEGLAARLFVENAGASQISELAKALDKTIRAYRRGDPQQILREKNQFYEVLFVGAGSPTLSSMLESLHARIWRWRAVGLSHPRRSAARSAQSIAALQALLEAVRAKKASAAERIIRDEANKAFLEVKRLLGNGAETRNNSKDRVS